MFNIIYIYCTYNKHHFDLMLMAQAHDPRSKELMVVNCLTVGVYLLYHCQIYPQNRFPCCLHLVQAWKEKSFWVFYCGTIICSLRSILLDHNVTQSVNEMGYFKIKKQV